MDTKSNPVSKKQAVTSRISYAFGAFGHDIFYATLSTYFITFITSHLFNTGDAAEKIIAWFYTSLRLLQVCVLSN